MIRALALLLVMMWLAPPAVAAPLRVVATFSILGDIVARVGDENIVLTTLVGPEGDAHAYQPRPADAVALAGADLVIVNGFGFEGWIDRLVSASGYAGPVVRAARDAVRMPLGGSNVDPHAWQDAGRARAYVETIADALAAADPDRTEVYRARATAYAARLSKLHEEIQAMFAAIPPTRRRVVTAHNAFGYFAAAYGVTFRSPQGLGAEAEPSAHQVAKLIRQIRSENITAVFVESVRNPRLVQQIARETGATVAGPLYADSLSAPDGPATTYLDLMRHNATLLARAMAAGAAR
ncbi:MAG: zinc ABC transporter substrate-binding protein [Alphaproteobacteria bacterium]